MIGVGEWSVWKLIHGKADSVCQIDEVEDDDKDKILFGGKLSGDHSFLIFDSHQKEAPDNKKKRDEVPGEEGVEEESVYWCEYVTLLGERSVMM